MEEKTMIFEKFAPLLARWWQHCRVVQLVSWTENFGYINN